MGSKSGFIVGFGAGYVLGAKAGRQRYEQIRHWWDQFSGSPTVQRAAGKTRDMAGEGARRGMHAVQQGVEKAGTAVKERLHRSDEPTDIVDLMQESPGSPPL
jgi:hypothetical protein